MAEIKNIVVWGASGFAGKIADIIRLTGKYHIAGFLDDSEDAVKGTPFCGAEILGGREELQALLDAGISELAFGFGNCHAKIELSLQARELGFNLPVLVHKSAIIADSAQLGSGTIVGAGAVVESGCRIGGCVCINTRATVGHDGVIGDFTHVGPGVTIAGRSTVGRISRIGAGATVIDGISIGAGTFIGAGSLVVKDMPEQVVAFGSPARIVRKSDGKF